MSFTSKEIAEELAKQLEGPSDLDVALIIAALDEKEREGYLRGIEDAANLTDKEGREIFAYGKELQYAGSKIVSHQYKIRALAREDVKP